MSDFSSLYPVGLYPPSGQTKSHAICGGDSEDDLGGDPPRKDNYLEIHHKINSSKSSLRKVEELLGFKKLS